MHLTVFSYLTWDFYLHFSGPETTYTPSSGLALFCLKAICGESLSAVPKKFQTDPLKKKKKKSSLSTKSKKRQWWVYVSERDETKYNSAYVHVNVGGSTSPQRVIMSSVIAQSSINGALHARDEGGIEGGKKGTRKKGHEEGVTAQAGEISLSTR